MRKDGCRLGENCHLPQKSEAWCWGRSQLQGIWFVLSLLPRLHQAWSSDLLIERELISVTAPVVYQCLSTLSTPFPGEFCHLCSREARKKKEKPKRSRPEAHDMAYHGIGPWSKSAQNAFLIQNVAFFVPLEPSLPRNAAFRWSRQRHPRSRKADGEDEWRGDDGRLLDGRRENMEDIWRHMKIWWWLGG